jgi:hypothetical protein
MSGPVKADRFSVHVKCQVLNLIWYLVQKCVYFVYRYMIATLASCMHHHDKKRKTHAVCTESRSLLGSRSCPVVNLTSKL